VRKYQKYKSLTMDNNMEADLPAAIIEAIQKVIGLGRFNLDEPIFRGNESRYVEECIDSTFILSVGKFVDRFEAELAAYTGARHAVAVVNGTAALHVALQLAGVMADDEVIIPALTLVATANAVKYCGAIPLLADCDTTSGGGAILTNDASLARHAKHLTTTAKVLHRWEFVHDEVGYNYRMPNINAALDCAQLEQLPDFLASKSRLYARYRDAFAGLDQVRLMGEPAGCVSNYWLQTLILDEAIADQCDTILTATNDVGLMTRPAWTLMHQLPLYRDCPRTPLPVAESVARRIINLPSSAGLA